MTDLERDEIEALAQIEDAEADAVIAYADADLAELAGDVAAELEQDLELVDAIEEVKAFAGAQPHHSEHLMSDRVGQHNDRAGHGACEGENESRRARHSLGSVSTGAARR